jgi:hypothetical protein
LIAAGSLAVLCGIVLAIDAQGGNQVGRIMTKALASNGGAVASVHSSAMHVARSAWDLSYVYGPLMGFAAVALLLLLCMLWGK